MPTEDEIRQKCLDLITQASKLHDMAQKSHCKSEAKRYTILAEAKQEEADNLLKTIEEE